MIVAQNYL